MVGYNCSQHTDQDRYGFDDNDKAFSPRPKDIAAVNALDDQNDRREETNIETATDSPLRAQLLAKFEQVFDTDERFIPAGDLEQVLTSHAIKAALQSHGLEDLYSFVYQRAKRTFAILLVVRKLDALQDLIREDWGDEFLPVVDAALISRSDKRLPAAFSEWDLDTRKRFSDIQWAVLVPVFSEAQHLKLDDNARLPFIKTDMIASGAFGTVSCVEIHRDHEQFEKFESPTNEKGRVYALKQFSQVKAHDNRRAFDRELAVLRSLRSSGHDHIMGYWASFEQQGRYSIIFPLAEENLRQFWANTTPSSVTSHWYLQQMTGIATALDYLHNDLLAQDSSPLSGYHHDIKPENILVFVDGSSAHRFKISDFGASYLYPKESRQELPPHPGLGTYEPPECQLDLPQSQAYDVWSLGCIFLECLTWLMKGSSAIEDFAEDRLNDVEICGNMFKDDYFFTLEFNESYTPVRAMTRPAVIKWIRALERDAKCIEAIPGLLHLIENGLLQVDQSKRLQARILSQRLELIQRVPKSEPQPISQENPEPRVMEIED